VAWLFYIGMSRLSFTEEQIGDMSLKKFFRLYEAYKKTFDVEMLRKAYKKTYETSGRETNMDDVIPF
jgi:hypothetical protein